MDILWELERLMLYDLEELEDIGCIEGDAAKDKCVQAGSQGVNVSWSSPATSHKHEVIEFPVSPFGYLNTSLTLQTAGRCHLPEAN